MKKIKSYFLITLLVLALGFLFNPTPATSQDTEYQIGLLTPKSGQLGPLGQTFENGANLAIKDLNSMQDDITFSLVVEDTQSTEDGATEAMTSLASAGVIGVVGAAASGSTIAAIDIAKSNEIPMVSYASTSPTITDLDDGDFLFRVVPSDAFQGLALAELANREGISNIGIIHLGNNYGQGLVSSFENAYNQSVATTQPYNQEATDFSSQVSSVAQSNADGILLVSYNEDGALILDELAQQNVNLPILGTDGVKSPEVFNDVSNASNYVGVKGTAPLTENNTDFFNDYVNEYNSTPSIFVPESYDATKIIGEAAIEAGEAEACEVANELRTVGDGYDGVSGTITFDNNGDQVSASYEFWEAQSGGTFAQTDTFTPEVSASGGGDVPDDHCSDSGGLFGIPFSFGGFIVALSMVGITTYAIRRNN